MHTESSSVLADVDTAFQAFALAFVGGSMAALWSTETQCTGVQTTQLDPVSGKNVAQINTTVNYKGTGSGNALPQRASLVLGLRTDTPTRAGRGRFSMPACDTSQLTATGQFASATAQTLATSLAGDLNTLGATTQAVIYHRATKTFTPVTVVTVGQTLGSQRRRTNKVPENYAYATI
uniref:Uncharacterized protein n=1 Tax=uncultured prokaryote TaxID=198431 RepID=A0A0H5Q1X1_9ZZZZ|nr:hypothetical protein [uncultured prokaryote]